MPHRPIVNLAASLSLASIALAAPATAQDHAIEPVDTRYDGVWQGDWQDANTWQGEWTGTYTDAEGRTVDAVYEGTFIGEHRFVSDEGHVLTHDGEYWRQHHAGSGYTRPALAYGPRERAQWLADCQYLMADGGGYYRDTDYERGPDGAVIGGLLGAVAGGVAGNRIADGDRLLGTVVGAGLGGLAGAAIGEVVDGEDDYRGVDRNALWAARYCDAYLRRYEMGGGVGFARHVAAAPAYPADMRIRRQSCDDCREIVIEEVIEEIAEAPEPAPQIRARRVIQPRGKRQTAD
ncbi:glycine zipper 2TM domain-containing protein [Aurantiacibacter aquimixticola]|uniref:17 kDa surface antigen n=1 Tax=Aurantiacibacter aquimixticola TaxID=1958945 RepID=A0A419RUW4_9SPHN|nr:glycine zipper 2TM domain-containing protein [Aurantiacibacter aquimixticola]RJY09583.1 glycine zipper 2TM domain-containing protein [Aurantiacibacter aquimixticola]